MIYGTVPPLEISVLRLAAPLYHLHQIAYPRQLHLPLFPMNQVPPSLPALYPPYWTSYLVFAQRCLSERSQSLYVVVADLRSH